MKLTDNQKVRYFDLINTRLELFPPIFSESLQNNHVLEGESRVYHAKTLAHIPCASSDGTAYSIKRLAGSVMLGIDNDIKVIPEEAYLEWFKLL